MKDTKKIILNILIFALLIFFTYYFIFKDYDMKYVMENIRNLDLCFLVLAFATMFLYFVLEALNIRLILKSFNEKLSVFQAIKNVLICFFFSAITPGGSGGQPIAIYYLSKEKINVSHSTMAFLIELFGYNCSKVIIGTVSYFLLPDEISSELRLIFIIGFCFSMVPTLLTLIGIFYKKLAAKLVGLTIRILKFFKVKDMEEKEKVIREELKLFSDSSHYVKKHKKEFIKSIVLSALQVLTFYIIPFIVYKSLHLDGISILMFIACQAVIHCSASSIPIPGAVGITETVFLVIYGFIYASPDLLQSSLIVSRMVTFYVYVVVSLIVYLITLLKVEKKS